MKRNEQKGVFRCSSKKCGNRELSIRKGTFFFGGCLSCRDILRLGHLWLAGVAHTSAVVLTGHSSTTVTAYFKHFRQLVEQSLVPEDQVIGGPGIIVEVDETKLGKRKYNRGHRVNGVWVVVGVERTEECKMFLIPVENRSATTLTQIISSHVAPGSIVYTDCWRGYSQIQPTLHLQHCTVNHSQCFKDPISGVCTNKVEGVNSGLKRKIPNRNRVEHDIDCHLAEYIWRKKCNENLWESFIAAMRDVHYNME